MEERDIFESRGGLKGKTVAVDSYTWLYALARDHAVDIVVKKDHAGLVKTFVRRASHLVKAGIIPLFVFDGDKAPAKSCTHQERERRRIRAMNQMDGADEPPDAAGYAKQVKITFEVVVDCIKELRRI